MFLPQFLYPNNPILRVSVLVLAFFLEYIYPYHRGTLLTIHPVHTSYILAKKMGRKYSSRIRGVITWFTVIITHISAYTALLYIAWCISPILWVIVAAYILKTAFSLRLLFDIIAKITMYLEENDLVNARKWTQMLVRRNVYELDEPHVISAAIESLSESMVDGFISPLFYFIFLGPLGALFQRITNTLDSALGYKTEEYINVGWFSAKMDTIINYIPARLTAILYIFSCIFFPECNIYQAYRTWRKYSKATESKNAGHPISAISGILGTKLEKIGHYTIGSEYPYPSLNKLRRAYKYSILVATLWIIITLISII
jgi:adenosylcobinamide-phosphate synthase